MSLVSIDVSQPCSEPWYNWIYAVLWSLNAPGPEERECKVGKKMEREELEMLLLLSVNKWVYWRDERFSISLDHLFIFSDVNIMLYFRVISLIAGLFLGRWLKAALFNIFMETMKQMTECDVKGVTRLVTWLCSFPQLYWAFPLLQLIVSVFWPATLASLKVPCGIY